MTKTHIKTYTMKAHIATTLLLLISAVTISQTKTSLSEQLWDRVRHCQSMLENSDGEEGVAYETLVDDSKNGYLQIAGSYPTCGCRCQTTVAAYKDIKGEYTFLSQELWLCSWRNTLSSNKELKAVFPSDLLDNGFFSEALKDSVGTAYFYLDIELPQVGTDTKVSIERIPLGLQKKNNSILAYHYSEEDLGIASKIMQIRNIAQHIKDENFYLAIANKQADEFFAYESKAINSAIGDDLSSYQSKKELYASFLQLKHAYDLYCSITHQTLILAWDKTSARFFIKSKHDKPQVISFRNFLLNSTYWSAIC